MGAYILCGHAWTMWSHAPEKEKWHITTNDSHINTSTPPAPKVLPMNQHKADGPNNDQHHLGCQVYFFCLILFLLLMILFLVSYLLQTMLPSYHATHLNPQCTPPMPYTAAACLCSQGGNRSHFWTMSHHCHVTSTTNLHMSHCS